MVNTLDRSMSTLHVYEPTIFNRDFLYYGCFHCLFAPASLPWDAFYERVLFVVIQISERSKGCDCYRLAHENLGTARSSFSCWITLNYLSSDTSNFGQISNVVAREESSGFQFAWCVVWKLWDGNLLVKIGSELDRSSTRGRRVFLPCLSTICSGKRRMQSTSNYFQLQEWQYTTFQIKGRLF